MQQNRNFDTVERMVIRKFPRYRRLRASVGFDALDGALRGDQGRADDDRREYLDRARTYRSELEAMSAESLAEADQQEQAKIDEQARARTAAETARFVEERRAKAERFFNQPQSLANFRYWAKAAYWTLEEATALSFGKNPGVVNSESVKPHAGYSPFPADYARLKELVERARDFRQISDRQIGDKVTPSEFIAWAKRTGIDFAQARARREHQAFCAHLQQGPQHQRTQHVDGQRAPGKAFPGEALHGAGHPVAQHGAPRSARGNGQVERHRETP